MMVEPTARYPERLGCSPGVGLYLLFSLFRIFDTIATVDDPDGRLIRLVPETMFTNNVSYFRTGPALAWP